MSGTTSLEDLQLLLKNTLENRGSLTEFRARLRAEVYNVLNDQAEEKPSLTSENLLINELILEYLVFNNYNYTASVLIGEAGQPRQRLDHNFLAGELNVVDDSQSSKIPLLYSVLSHFVGKNDSTADPKVQRDATEEPSSSD